jgi:hypothetical protein
LRTRRLTALLIALACTTCASAQPDARNWGAQGYSGLKLRDIPGGHVVVSWIFPGPLEGEGLTAPASDLARGDLIVSVNGQGMTAAEFETFERQAFPRDPVTIEYRRFRQRGSSAIPGGIDHEDDVQRLEFKLASRDLWSGTIGRGCWTDQVIPFTRPRLLDVRKTDDVLGGALAEHDLAEPFAKLEGVFETWLEKDEDFHRLRRLRQAFENPTRLPEISEATLEWFSRDDSVTERPLITSLRVMQDNLDASDAGGYSITQARPAGRSQLETIALLQLFHSDIALDKGMGLGNLRRDDGFVEKCLALLRVPRDTFYITGPSTPDHLEVIRSSMGIKYGSLIQAAGRMGAFILMTEEMIGEIEPIDALPEELSGAVEGEIISASFADSVGWVVVGGRGDNRYDMARVKAVIDPGGNDEYYASETHFGVSAITDFDGDDVYTGTPDQGPGGGLLGVAFIEDRAGNDRYLGEMLSGGAAMFGAGIIIDRAGDDLYTGTDWSLGAACYGAGFLIDLGDGSDTYEGEYLCQGVGGPRGLGFIVDEAGRDLYRADGPVPSAYDTPGVHQSFSQGIGFGFRHYAAGGLGIIHDLAGDDRYEAGEFAQGGAYYYGIGLLHDASGRDLYRGNRYGQGFGVHQAVGMLVDDEGDDTYCSMTAASQGAAWDIGVGLLLDRAGDDTYEADGLAQGAASMQGIGMLVDLAGRDRYRAGGGATQGQSGGNSYHFEQTGAWSFSLLLDLGGSEDWYSRGRANNAVEVTGSLRADSPQDSDLHGLFIDR